MDTKLRNKRILRLSIVWLVLQVTLTLAGQQGHWISSEVLVAGFNLPAFLGSLWVNMLGVAIIPPTGLLMASPTINRSYAIAIPAGFLGFAAFACLVLGTVGGLVFTAVIFLTIAAAM